MPNIHFEVKRANSDSGPELVARIQAVNQELRGFIRALVAASAAEGERIAKRTAPHDRELRHGPRIVDAIRVEETEYHPGGAGGGGFYESRLTASSLIAPHLKFVMEGTRDQGAGKIYPSGGNLGSHVHTLGGVFPIEKEGEGIHFRSWVHGQKKQDLWWDLAQEAMQQMLSAGIRDLNLDESKL